MMGARVVVQDGVRRYECTLCEKTFSKSYNLRAHHRLHTGERPFKCPYPGCNKDFSWKSSLTSHKQTHARAASQISSKVSEQMIVGGNANPQNDLGGKINNVQYGVTVMDRSNPNGVNPVPPIPPRGSNVFGPQGMGYLKPAAGEEQVNTSQPPQLQHPFSQTQLLLIMQAMRQRQLQDQQNLIGNQSKQLDNLSRPQVAPVVTRSRGLTQSQNMLRFQQQAMQSPYQQQHLLRQQSQVQHLPQSQQQQQLQQLKNQRLIQQHLENQQQRQHLQQQQQTQQQRGGQQQQDERWQTSREQQNYIRLAREAAMRQSAQSHQQYQAMQTAQQLSQGGVGDKGEFSLQQSAEKQSAQNMQQRPPRPPPQQLQKSNQSAESSGRQAELTLSQSDPQELNQQQGASAGSSNVRAKMEGLTKDEASLKPPVTAELSFSEMMFNPENEITPMDVDVDPNPLFNDADSSRITASAPQLSENPAVRIDAMAGTAVESSKEQSSAAVGPTEGGDIQTNNIFPRQPPTELDLGDCSVEREENVVDSRGFPAHGSMFTPSFSPSMRYSPFPVPTPFGDSSGATPVQRLTGTTPGVVFGYPAVSPMPSPPKMWSPSSGWPQSPLAPFSANPYPSNMSNRATPSSRPVQDDWD